MTALVARALVAGIVLALVSPALAFAHPLGNFTVNHYAGIRVEPDRLLLDVVVDQAEIPTFQERLRIDTDGDGSVSDAEAEAERVAACPALAPSLDLRIGGTSLPLETVEAGLTFPPGAAGLQTMRLVCVFAAPLGHALAAGTSVAFSDSSHPGRIGWREVTATGSGVSIGAGAPPTGSVSQRLTAYPAALIPKPLDVRSAAFEVSPGGPVLAPLVVTDAAPIPGTTGLASTPPDRAAAPASGPSSSSSGSTVTPPQPAGVAALSSSEGVIAAVPGGVGSEISTLLEQHDLTPLVLFGSLLAAMALGAGHALTPGHGKTLMGAYLVGTRGTPVHAVALGLSVTVSHTLGVLVLAAVVVGLRGVISPELFNRVAPLVSGLLVLGIGTWLLGSQVAGRRARSTAAGHAADHDREAATGLGAPPAIAPGHAATHRHGGTAHRDLPPPDATVGWRSLFVLGLAGGIIPSTNALIILLATIATGRALYGLILVVAFGLGMAVVLGGVGLGLVLARDRVETLPARSSLGVVAGWAPVAAGVLVVTLGVWLTGQAIGVAPTL